MDKGAKKALDLLRKIKEENWKRDMEKKIGKLKVEDEESEDCAGEEEKKKEKSLFGG